MSLIDFRNKTVLITGGSRGIGAACAELFAELGATVIITFKSAQETAKKLESRKFAEGIILSKRVNIESEEDIINCVNFAVEQSGSIDILVNNAGIWKHSPVDKMNLSQWEETIRINLNSAFLFCRYTIPLMKKSGSGKIINISSTAGQRGEAEYSNYAASKGGIIAFTKSLASETGSYGINVNCVAPGWVNTDMTMHIMNDPHYKDEIKKNIPLGRIASARDVAMPVIFLASEMARHITGEILNVNGGSVLCG